MAILDDLKSGVNDAVQAGATAVRAAGANLRQDFESFVKPNLDAILAEIAMITKMRVLAEIGGAQAKMMIEDQISRIDDIIITAAALLVQQVQNIIDAVVGAVRTVVNDYVHFPLL